MTDILPSWRPGATRDAIIAFLHASGDVPVDERVAYVDNDGTMWCEKPTYVQLDFFVDALQQLEAVRGVRLDVADELGGERAETRVTAGHGGRAVLIAPELDVTHS